MLRLVFAVLLSLGCHLALLIAPVPWKTDIPPRLMGEKAISIKFSISAVAETVKTTSENNENAIPVPLAQQQGAKPVKTAMKSVVEVPNFSETSPSPLDKANIAGRVVLKPHRQKKRNLSEISSQLQAVDSKPLETETVKSQNSIEASQSARTAAPAVAVNSDARPLYELNPQPGYPQIARRRGWHGTVLLMVLVSMDGVPEKVSIETSSGYNILDDEALKVIKHWKFLPGKQDGALTAMKVFVPVSFVLE